MVEITSVTKGTLDCLLEVHSKVVQLEALSGQSIDTLIFQFQSGYQMTPPVYNNVLARVLKGREDELYPQE